MSTLSTNDSSLKVICLWFRNILLRGGQACYETLNLGEPESPTLTKSFSHDFLLERLAVHHRFAVLYGVYSFKELCSSWILGFRGRCCPWWEGFLACLWTPPGY